jgi:hypothetical protein
MNFFPARVSMVSDIPAGDGKIANLFYSVCVQSLVLALNRYIIISKLYKTTALFKNPIVYISIHVKT